MHEISIVVVTKNQEENLYQFVKQVDVLAHQERITYEIIFVDLDSTDLSQRTIAILSHMYPITLIISHSKRTISQLAKGIKKAHFPLILTIPLYEYPIRAIPSMVKKITDGYDVIIAKRVWKQKTNIQNFWGKYLYALDVDYTSQLKIFKKSVFQSLKLTASMQHNFDLEFIIKAKGAGFQISEITIPFEKYFVEKKKENNIKTTLDISRHAINLKFSEPDVIPQTSGFLFRGKEFIHFSHIAILDSAFFRVVGSQKKLFFSALIIFIFCTIVNWHTTIIFTLTILTALYFSDLLFHLFLIFRSFTASPEITILDDEIAKRQDWPTYTILSPLYRESRILPQFLRAISSIEYPKDKLQVLLLLEEDDEDTKAKIAHIRLPNFCKVRMTPLTNPKTKPKALNYGLQFAKGEYTVVYDAEDIPDPLQLKKAILAFEKSSPAIKCIQAKLNFYNPFQNTLTKIFTAEYSLWFDLILTGLQSANCIIPLGGTSNHFRTQDLKDIHGWDSFNVTEDCDLGLRIVRLGFQTAIVNSTTLEEANSNPINWFYQRGRWIKGYMQTYLVHTRHPGQFIKNTSLIQFLAFQLVIGGKVLSLFINPLMWIITIAYFLFRPIIGTFIESFFPGPVMYIGVLSLVFGNFLYMYYYMIGCAKREQYGLIKYAFLVPLYWLGMSASSLQALVSIITRPYHWPKTNHGLHLRPQLS